MLRTFMLTVFFAGVFMTTALRAGAADDSTSEPVVSAPGKLSPELQTLQYKVRRALQIYSSPRLNSHDHNAWEMMHAIIGYGVRSQIHRDGPHGPSANTIGWLCYNFPCKNERMLVVEDGRVDVRRGVGVQGHPGQFLAILAQSRVQTTYPILCNGKRFTVADLIESEKRGCKTGMELTFKLISMAHYLDSNATWKNEAGEEWSISKLIHEEIKAPINGAACGGTHRLMGLSYAAHRREQQGQPIDGEFRRAKAYTDEFHRYTLSLQNADGSFSTEWFKEAGARPDLNRRLQTSGHILEWLAYSLPEEQLTEPRMLKAANYLSGILLATPQREWEIGPLGHAMHSLVLYDERVFQARERAEQTPLASKEPARRSIADDESDDEIAHRTSRRREGIPAPATDTEPAGAKPSTERLAADKPAPANMPADKPAPEELADDQPVASKPVAVAPIEVPDQDSPAARPQPISKPEIGMAPPALVGETAPSAANPPTEASPDAAKPIAEAPLAEAPTMAPKPAPLPPTDENSPPAEPTTTGSAKAPAEEPTAASVMTLKRSPALPRHEPAWRR